MYILKIIVGSLTDAFSALWSHRQGRKAREPCWPVWGTGDDLVAELDLNLNNYEMKSKLRRKLGVKLVPKKGPGRLQKRLVGEVNTP